MTIKQLRELIADQPEDMEVLIPLEPMEGFTGNFFSPCMGESNVIALAEGEPLDDEEIKEYELLNKEIPKENSFLLVPCGFFKEHEGVAPELN